MGQDVEGWGSSRDRVAPVGSRAPAPSHTSFLAPRVCTPSLRLPTTQLPIFHPPLAPPPPPPGARDISELKEHAFFAGVDWGSLRSGPAPEYVPPEPPAADEEGLDWELTSLVRNLPAPPPQQQP